MPNQTILIVEDEAEIREGIRILLSGENYSILEAENGEQALSQMSDQIDLVILDVMMPGIDGFELVRRIRPAFDGPIVFLTAKVAEEDAVVGYGLGADDYVRKPFGAAELRAKVAAHLRREGRERTHALSFGDVRIDLGSKEVSVGGSPVALTPTEYGVCELLARRRGQVLSRAQIRESVLGWESEADDDAISMHVSRARRKLSAAGADPIETVWGMGYKWQL